MLEVEYTVKCDHFTSRNRNKCTRQMVIKTPDPIPKLVQAGWVFHREFSYCPIHAQYHTDSRTNADQKI